MFLIPETHVWVLKNLLLDHGSYKHFENVPLMQRIYYSDKAISTF